LTFPVGLIVLSCAVVGGESGSIVVVSGAIVRRQRAHIRIVESVVVVVVHVHVDIAVVLVPVIIRRGIIAIDGPVTRICWRAIGRGIVRAIDYVDAVITPSWVRIILIVVADRRTHRHSNTERQ
jgi:hypothetical protein